MSVIKGSETSIVLNPKSIITSSFFRKHKHHCSKCVSQHCQFFIKNELMNTVCLWLRFACPHSLYLESNYEPHVEL